MLRQLIFVCLLCLSLAGAIPSQSYQVYDPACGYLTISFTTASVTLNLEQWAGRRISAIPMHSCSCTILTTQSDIDMMLAMKLTDGHFILLFEQAELKLECHSDESLRITTFNNLLTLVDYPYCRLHPWTNIDTSMIATARRFITE